MNVGIRLDSVDGSAVGSAVGSTVVVSREIIMACSWSWSCSWCKSDNECGLSICTDESCRDKSEDEGVDGNISNSMLSNCFSEKTGGCGALSVAATDEDGEEDDKEDEDSVAGIAVVWDRLSEISFV